MIYLYYINRVFPGVGLNYNRVSNQLSVPSYEQSQTTVNPITSEQSYIENILRLNRGKKAKFHVTVPGSEKWQDRVFEGIVEQSGRDQQRESITKALQKNQKKKKKK